MLKIIEIVLKAKADEEIQKAEKSLASIMNDVLMQYVDDKYREYLSMQRRYILLADCNTKSRSYRKYSL